jgi:hypothetical protein
MTKEFYQEYLKPENRSRKQALYVMNPAKFRACQFLINYHEQQRGDKILVFSDNIFALREYVARCSRVGTAGWGGVSYDHSPHSSTLVSHRLWSVVKFVGTLSPAACSTHPRYALLLKKPFIYGAISHVERTRILNAFKHNPQVPQRRVWCGPGRIGWGEQLTPPLRARPPNPSDTLVARTERYTYAAKVCALCLVPRTPAQPL